MLIAAANSASIRLLRPDGVQPRVQLDGTHRLDGITCIARPSHNGAVDWIDI
jgi:hypothetical protein